MNNLAFLAAAALVLVAAPAAAQSGPTEPAYVYSADVVRIVDGDTIDLDIDLGFYVWARQQRIHLLGIDAPEIEGASEAAGVDAADFLTGLVLGRTVIVYTVPGPDDPERNRPEWYGTIYLDAEDLNQLMIDEGFAVAVP